MGGGVREKTKEREDEGGQHLKPYFWDTVEFEFNENIELGQIIESPIGNRRQSKTVKIFDFNLGYTVFIITEKKKRFSINNNFETNYSKISIHRNCIKL